MPTDAHGLAYELTTGFPPAEMPANIQDIADFDATAIGHFSHQAIQIHARTKAKDEAGFHDTVRYRILWPTGETSTVIYAPREPADESHFTERGWSIETEE